MRSTIFGDLINVWREKNPVIKKLKYKKSMKVDFNIEFLSGL